MSLFRLINEGPYGKLRLENEGFWLILQKQRNITFLPTHQAVPGEESQEQQWQP